MGVWRRNDDSEQSVGCQTSENLVWRETSGWFGFDKTVNPQYRATVVFDAGWVSWPQDLEGVSVFGLPSVSRVKALGRLNVFGHLLNKRPFVARGDAVGNREGLKYLGTSRIHLYRTRRIAAWPTRATSKTAWF